METAVIDQEQTGAWSGGKSPFNVSYGKMMMWYFIVSDALTFTGFLCAYGLTRFKFIESWPIADEVFTHFPFLHGVEAPMYYVAFMTFVLIFSSVTMVLAVDAGHHMNKNKVSLYMGLTIIGGLIFLGSQAWEWKNFIQGSQGAFELGPVKDMKIGDKQLHFNYSPMMHVGTVENGKFHKISMGQVLGKDPHGPIEVYPYEDVMTALKSQPNLYLRVDNNNNNIVKVSEGGPLLDNAERIIYGAGLHRNEYGKAAFADFFFFITGFHGFHVFSGVVLNVIIFLNVLLGTYEKRNSYEMVEKVGLYWHFVDLVWVFVFTFFYLV